MLKASWGGGGRGMRAIDDASQLIEMVATARREAKAAFGNDEVYLEKLVRRARHVEVQILGDTHGNLVHLYERDCTVQRRNQKVVERAPAVFLDDTQRLELCELGLRIGRAVGYLNAGTVEFLQDADTGQFYFIEVNPRIQVEHTVTEVVTGIDIVKAQIRIAEGAAIGTPASGVPAQPDIRITGHAMQCRVTTEDPENHFIPDYGRITAYRSPAGFGIRLDAGTAYSGAFITRSYDSLLVKVTAWAPSSDETIARMDRALKEFRVRGVSTNLRFLEQLITHEHFRDGSYTTKFIDQTPELFRYPRKRDRATRLLRFVADVIVNGNPEVTGRVRPGRIVDARPPKLPVSTPPPGTKQRLDELGARRFSQWMLEQPQVLFTDTTFRDAHQSLLATRLRTRDLVAIAPAYARLAPDLFSVECWGGATFDVAMRFLRECPWDRLIAFREAMPNLLLQMLLRSANAVGYTNYPDNVVRYFVQQAAKNGVDVFRVFDSLNWVDNMRVAMDAVGESGKLCEAAICYTGNLSDPRQTKYDLKYYVAMAKQLEQAGAHILGIKDMAGLCQPRAAHTLVKALKEEIGIPVHFHTHDTSGIAAASVLAAIDAGCDAVDGALDAMSGLTSQPNLGSIVEALRHGPRESGLDPDNLRVLSNYWEQVRHGYAAFESDMRSGASEVYVHGMPGGQYTNLREQARSLGIDDTRWHEVARAYAAGQRDVRRHRQGHAVVEGRRRHGDHDGDQRAHRRGCRRSADRRRVPGVRRRALPWRHRSARRRLPARTAEEDPRRRAALDFAPGRALAAGRSRAGARAGAGEDAARHHRSRVRVVADVPEGVLRLHGGSHAFRRRQRAADARFLLRPGSGRRNHGRSREGQAPDHPLRRDQRRARRRHAHRVLRAERSTAVGEGAGPEQGGKATAAPQGRDRSPGRSRRADAGHDRHGQRAGRATPCARGDVLVTIEAMKMETSVRAERDGVIAEVIARPGQQVDAKDLLLVLEPATA